MDILLNQRQKNILGKTDFPASGLTSGEVFSFFNEGVSLVTLRRDLQGLAQIGYLEKNGKGPSTRYIKTISGALFSPIDAKKYNSIEPDKRNGSKSFDFELFEKFPKEVFSESEKKVLDDATNQYRKKVGSMTEVIQSKELERFVIEMSWKSSKIEGNTYTLLDTERLIREGIPAQGHGKDEAIMIINHKKAFSFIKENIDIVRKQGINKHFTEKVHELLVQDLGVSRGVRSGLVGITGTTYRPLDNAHQIHEALETMYRAVNRMTTPYAKALVVLLGISYIQPFEDGNKRTARLLANAMLMAEGCAPLSYRSVDEESYKESVLVFYERHSLFTMKQIFIEQYLFSAMQYAVSDHVGK